MKPRIIKGSLKNLILGYIVFCFMFILYIALFIRDNDLESLYISVIIGVFIVAVSIAVKKYKIKIRNNSMVCYSRPFGKDINFEISQIKKAYIEIGVNETKDLFRPFVRLKLISIDNCGLGEFVIRYKFFRAKDIEDFMDLLPMDEEE